MAVGPVDYAVCSVDRGKTFSPPIRISTHARLPRDDNGGLVGPVGVVGADGTIYAVWNDGSTIAFTQSHDGGKTFAPAHVAVEVASALFRGRGRRTGSFASHGLSSGWRGRAAGQAGGRLYLAWSDFRNGDIDVFCVSAKDHGRTWSEPVRVNNDLIHDGIDQFFQWLAVDPATGDV